MHSKTEQPRKEETLTKENQTENEKLQEQRSKV